MATIARRLVSFNPSAAVVTHAALVVLGVSAALLVAYSPAPMWAAVVLAIVFGVHTPIALRNFLGVRLVG
ncbi:hypothetical protein IU483_35270 [Streptomyces gardneri]|nr:hypothetical protein [Streptomyces gardneri]